MGPLESEKWKIKRSLFKGLYGLIHHLFHFLCTFGQNWKIRLFAYRLMAKSEWGSSVKFGFFFGNCPFTTRLLRKDFFRYVQKTSNKNYTKWHIQTFKSSHAVKCVLAENSKFFKKCKNSLFRALVHFLSTFFLVLEIPKIKFSLLRKRLRS